MDADLYRSVVENVTCDPSRLRARDALSSGRVSPIHQILRGDPQAHKGERSQETK
jgi:hypothetical protein